MAAQRGVPHRDRGALENDVLAALTVGPMTPRQMLDHLGGDLAYTTVMTTLARLHRKGAATREAIGRTFSVLIIASDRWPCNGRTANRRCRRTRGVPA